MKTSKQCPKCHSLRIGYLESQPDVEQALELKGGQQAQQAHQEGKRALGVKRGLTNTGLFNHGLVHEMVGKLEAYVCADCGYHETYVSDPPSIPWDSLRGFRWLNEGKPESDDPYR